MYGKESSCKSYLIVTDLAQKEKDCIYTFILRLMEELPYIEEGKTIVLYSDGPSSEFKNRFMVKLLSIISKKLNKQVFWKYFATSHGKEVVDEIGGSAKSLVRAKIKSKGDDTLIVKNSMDFLMLLKN